MKTVFASALVAATALTGAAYAATPAQLTEVQKYAPNADEFRLNMDGMYTGIDSIDLRTELGEEKKGGKHP